MQNEADISEAQCSIETRMRRPNSELKHLDRSRGAFHDHQHGRLYEADFKDARYNSSKIRAKIEAKIIDYYLNKSRRSHQKSKNQPKSRQKNMNTRLSQLKSMAKNTNTRKTCEKQNPAQFKRHDKEKSQRSTTSSRNTKQVQSQSIATKLLN